MFRTSFLLDVVLRQDVDLPVRVQSHAGFHLVDVPDEVLGDDHLRVPDGDDAPLLHYHAYVAVSRHQRDVVLRDQDGHVLPGHAPQIFHHLELVLHIEMSGGFVDEHELRLLHVRLGYQRALPLTRRAERQGTVAYMVQTERPQRFAGDAFVLRRLPPQAVHERIPSEDHHVHDGHVERGPHLRGDGCDQFGDLHRSEAGHVHPIDGHDSRCGFVDPADAPHHGGLPAPVRADQPDQLPASDVEIYIIEGVESSEVNGQAADGE